VRGEYRGGFPDCHFASFGAFALAIRWNAALLRVRELEQRVEAEQSRRLPWRRNLGDSPEGVLLIKIREGNPAQTIAERDRHKRNRHQEC
jgi:hypothetical protein